MKKTRSILAFAALLISVSGYAQLGPIVTSWKINNTITGYDNITADVQKVQYTDSFVYVSCTDIPDYTIGPTWGNDPNKPSNQAFTYKLPRYPQKNTATKTAVGLGHVAVLINGVSLFNASDANSYQNDNTWHQNAYVVEVSSFDSCYGHAQQQGEYHHHGSPRCLYDETDSSKHAPLLGFSFDGYPVYGDYSYAYANGTGKITRMRSSYRLRNITVRHTLADTSVHLVGTQYGPNVSTQYPLGYYLEDYEYVPGLGQLDSNNGRYCVTPEYPKGTYAYFLTVDSSGYPVYPYTLGLNYYGTVTNDNIGMGSAKNTVPGTAATYTSIRPLSQPENIEYSLYPNPVADGNIYLKISSGEELTNLKATVYNSVGQVLQVRDNLQAGIEYTFSMKNLPGGIYFVKVESANAASVQKVIVAN